MATSKGSKLAAVGAASELQIIEQFGRPLGIQDSATLRLLQTACRHVVFTNPVARGKSEVRYEGVAEVLFVTRQPLLKTARLLLKLGCRPDAIIARRRVGRDADDMRAKLGVAARYTVDEAKTVFAIWKPFWQSTVRATTAESGGPADVVSRPDKSSRKRHRRRRSRGKPKSPVLADSEQA